MSKLLKSMSCKLSTAAIEGIVNKEASTSRKGKEKVIVDVDEYRNTPQLRMRKKKKEKEKAKPVLKREVATGKKKKEIYAYWKKLAANLNVVGKKKPKVKVSRTGTSTTTAIQTVGDDDQFNDPVQEQEARYGSSSSVTVPGAASAATDELAPTSGNTTPAATSSRSTTPSSSAAPSPRRGRRCKVDRHGNPIPPRSVVERWFFPH